MQNIQTESEKNAKEDPKTYSITLTAEKRKLIKYTVIAFAGYFLARHLVKSAVKSIKAERDL